jgi:cytochrome c556
MKSHVIVISCFLSSLLAAPVFAEEDTNNAIKYRQYLMSSISSHYKAIKYLAAGKISQKEQWLPHTTALNDTAKMFDSQFPEGSDFGETDAKEAIWENMDDFKQKNQDLVTASNNMIQSLKNKDYAAAAAQVDDLGKTCKACHKKYREK